MIEHFKNIFRRIFSNEETVIFFLIILSTLILFSLFIEVLTPFIISIVVAYLLVGLQKKIETYGVAQPVSTIIAGNVVISALFETPKANEAHEMLLAPKLNIWAPASE